MAEQGWKQLVEGWPWFRGEGRFPVFPNSEFMPPVRLGLRPYGTRDNLMLSEDDPWGWPISEYEEGLTLRPGLRDLAHDVMEKLVPLCRRDVDHCISKYKLEQNPYWPKELHDRAKALDHERFVLLLPLALSITQDDKANLRWTLYGNSEQGPARAFWKGFYTSPTREVPAEEALDFFRTLLSQAYEQPVERCADLRKAGFRILPLSPTSYYQDGRLPSWTADYLLGPDESPRGVTYLLTFRPYAELPAGVKRKYLAGDLHLLPFPGSLLFWGVEAYRGLGQHLRLAQQVPLLHLHERREWHGKIRVPQSGWFQESGPAAPETWHVRGPLRETYMRTHRHARVHRYDDYLVAAKEHRIVHVLFSSRPDDIDLYYKPMARNTQLWTHDFQPLLDGPAADGDTIRRAAKIVSDGGLFGYRFLFPAMAVGRHEVYWHRPLVAFYDPHKKQPVLIDNAPLGYLTAYRRGESNFDDPVELWPRLLRREPHQTNVELFEHLEEKPPRQTVYNVLKLLEAHERHDQGPLPRSFARQLLAIDPDLSLDGWLSSLPLKARQHDREHARRLVLQLRDCLEPESVRRGARSVERDERSEQPPTLDAPRSTPHAPRSTVHGSRSTLTFAHTGNRAFEEKYWKTIASLSSPDFANKNNADCVLDRPTQEALKHSWRDLEGVGDHLLGYYAKVIAERGMSDVVRFGELPFRWQTQYHFPWMGGWQHNQEGKAYERNLLVMIPGRDRSRAVIMADHYDTAYMQDWYEKNMGGTGARLSAAGADDNCSATAALMLGAPAFLELSQQGRLGCDVWLLHLTGEEYPAEGLGTCRMCQWLVEGTLALAATDGQKHDLSGVRVQGVYVLDMVAHNNDKERDIFQIAPGASHEALWLAYQAHLANEAWNAMTAKGNRQPARRKARRGRRCRDGKTIPALSRFLPLAGQVRPHYAPRSTLYNTDGQAFSDVGIPVVLFMENYDIDRVGYHDTHDNMKLIDLDYGAALAAITIESVARAATEEPPAASFLPDVHLSEQSEA